MTTPSTPTLHAVVLSAALTGPLAAFGEDYALPTPRKTFVWTSPEATAPSQTRVNMWSGTTLPTMEHSRSDPWDELSELPDNWDGSGASAVMPEAIRHAKRFLISLNRAYDQFEPFAHPNGSVGLEAHKQGRSAYLVVSSEDTYTYVIKSGATVHRGTGVKAADMQVLLEMLY